MSTKCLDINDADKMTWDEIVKFGDNYRIDSVVSALAMKSGQKIYKIGWANVSELERILCCIDEISCHCYMDGTQSLSARIDNDVNKFAVSAFEIIGSNEKTKLLKTALSGDSGVDHDDLTGKWCSDNEDLYDLAWKYIIKLRMA